MSAFEAGLRRLLGEGRACRWQEVGRGGNRASASASASARRKVGRRRLQAELRASYIVSACLYFRTQGGRRKLFSRRYLQGVCRKMKRNEWRKLKMVSAGRLQEDEAERRVEIEDGICRASAGRRSGTQGGNRERKAKRKTDRRWNAIRKTNRQWKAKRQAEDRSSGRSKSPRRRQGGRVAS